MKTNNDNVRKAFNKVKEDINYITNEIYEIKRTIQELILRTDNSKKFIENQQINQFTQKNTIDNIKLASSTIQHINPADSSNPTHIPTDNLAIEVLKTKDLGISIGNEGVPTDKQTNRQTDKPTHFLQKNSKNPIKNKEILEKNILNQQINEINKKNIENIELNLKQAEEILFSLDEIKKEIRLKFKHLTDQEMLVFSIVYQLDEENKEITYKSLSQILKLSESSIRDYIQRIINKGIPIKKEKQNNKKVILSISKDLKKIASLSTILKLREI